MKVIQKLMSCSENLNLTKSTTNIYEIGVLRC